MFDADRRAALLRQVVGRDGPVAPARDDWSDWLFLARLERAVPLLYQLVDRTPTDLDDDQRTEARQEFGTVMCRCVQLEHHTIAISRLLAEHGVRAVTLKGGATAHLEYPDPSWREFSDVDLLIDPADLVRARHLIESEGWAQGYALHHGHERFTHAVTFVRLGMELDLHQRIAHRALGRLLPTGDLMAQAVPFEIAGADLLALDDVDRFIHAAVHAVASGRDGQRLSGFADVLAIANRRSDLAEAVLTRAEEWRVRSLVERGLRDAYATAQLEVNAEWANAMARPIRGRDRLVDRAYLDTRRRPVLEELAHLRLLDGWRDRLRYVAGFFTGGRAGLPERVRYVWSKVRDRA